jgi:hypothetical protein
MRADEFVEKYGSEWLNEHMPADNPREWLRMVLDSVPAERRLLTALALEIAVWHPMVQIWTGGHFRPLCILLDDQCDSGCPCAKIKYMGNFDIWTCIKANGTTDAVYTELKKLYDEEWRRVGD